MNFNGFDFGGFFDIELALENLPFILGGLPMTLLVAVIGMGSGLVLGLFFKLFFILFLLFFILYLLLGVVLMSCL